MTESTGVTRPSEEFTSVRLFELIPGEEFMVFFAASEDELPDDSVRRELRIIAIQDRNDQERSVLGTIITDVISGAIGGATWAAIAATYAALAKYLSRKHGIPSADAATIVRRLTAASEKIPGPQPAALERLKVRQLEDKRWEAAFTCHGIAVRATLDPGGTIVKWSQRARK